MPRLHLPSSRNLFSLLLLLRKSRSLLPLFLLYGSYFTHALLFLELGSFHGLFPLPKKTVCFVFFGSFLRSAGTVQCVFFLFPFVLFLTELRFRLCPGNFSECFTLSPRLQHFELHLLRQLHNHQSVSQSHTRSLDEYLLLLTLSNKLDAFALAFHHLLPFALCFGLTHRQIVAASIGKLFLDDHHAGLDQLIYCIASQPVIRLQLHGRIIAVFTRAFEVRQTLHEDLFVSHTHPVHRFEGTRGSRDVRILIVCVKFIQRHVVRYTDGLAIGQFDAGLWRVHLCTNLNCDL